MLRDAYLLTPNLRLGHPIVDPGPHVGGLDAGGLSWGPDWGPLLCPNP
jgi:hypothetical protein